MPRQHRLSAAGLIFHVINRSAKRVRLFDGADDYRAFVAVLIDAAARFDVAVFAYCVMPNHWHLVISPRSHGELSRFMHWLTTTHARRWQLARGLDGLGAVYQGRFRAIPIAEDRHFLWVCRYVERNALRATLVASAEDWSWSSLGSRNHGDASWMCDWPVPRPAGWIDYVNEPQTQAELDAFRDAVERGEPFGDETWREALFTSLGMRRSRRRGRPRRTGSVL